MGSEMCIRDSSLFDKKEKVVNVYYFSNECSANEHFELFVGINSNKFTVVHPDHYYNDGIRNNRNNENMVSSWHPKERLVLVGNISGVKPVLQEDTIQIGKSEFEVNQYGT